ncbi:MAG: metal ABC transporter ATP-binding protein [Dehalococcoidia bacterium]
MTTTKFNSPEHNIIELHDVSIIRDSVEVLSGASCCIPRNALTFIVGENGSGKTSMISSILGLLSVQSGEITYHSETDKDLVIGYVPQSVEFPDHFQLTVTEYLKYSAGVSITHISETLKRVDFPETHIRKKVTELSGGQTQKLLLAAELSRDPDVLFLDEPLSNVDNSSEKHIIDVIMDIKNQGVTIVLISHDWQLVSSCADCVICLNKTAGCASGNNCACKASLSQANVELIQKTGPDPIIAHEGHCYVQNL